MAKLPEEILDFFKKHGRKGGKTAADSMTAEERSKRAKKAASKSAEVRSKKAAAKKKTGKKGRNVD
jgi:hypothetical protein